MAREPRPSTDQGEYTELTGKRPPRHGGRVHHAPRTMPGDVQGVANEGLAARIKAGVPNPDAAAELGR